ncbi:Methyl-accepting chemotaxis protein OS=Lysinibacillus sphaericus OX=1421 GN=LS41612_16565 PE=3 SV=1 [Lysinibacillus sphaericus]
MWATGIPLETYNNTAMESVIKNVVVLLIVSILMFVIISWFLQRQIIAPSSLC